MQSLVVDEIAGKVYKMEMGKRGIWVSFRSSSVVCLFDSIYYVKLMQVDYTTLLPGDPMAVTEKVRSCVVSVSGCSSRLDSCVHNCAL